MLPPGSIEANSILVTIETGASGEAIYYTDNGTLPDNTSTPYTGPISLSTSKAIKAVAVISGYQNSDVASAQYDLYWWQALGTGMNYTVNAIAFDNTGNLYAGGQFSQAGGVKADGVAVWHNSTWSQLGGGIYGRVNSIKVDAAGDVYLGGYVLWDSEIYGEYDNKLTKWNHNIGSLEVLGGRVSGEIYALEFVGTDLYAGGNFTHAGKVPNTYCIARWKPSASTWEALPLGEGGLNDVVYGLSALGSDLYVGGKFTSTEAGTQMRKLAKYNGAWTEIGNGGGIADYNNINHVNAFSGSDIVVGGDFLSGGGVNAIGLMRWNGANWSLIGGQHHFGEVVTSVNWGKYFCVGGSFPGSSPPSDGPYLARHDGVNWSTFGNIAMSSHIYALAVGPDGNLYAGGFFQNAGGIPEADYIAMWGKKL